MSTKKELLRDMILKQLDNIPDDAEDVLFSISSECDKVNVCVGGRAYMVPGSIRTFKVRVQYTKE